MNLLFELYAFSYPMSWVGSSRERFREAYPEAGMVVITVLTSVCTIGIAFYVWFLAALCKDSTRRWIGYLVRIEPGEGGDQILERYPKPEPAFREDTPLDVECV